ncbi:hypothetical protein [Candidatus Sulfurimonas baltica]|uniref:Uncharacterized protein n=1 Tax=Candidatus Sulfurimonas baltica TaxID=2740404 RepID=A0A7S7LX07_9BACT|nr:hypothetical protein [Candidatus Sulfurimonas baltica]QOY52897.1 hypothetical protein HUE88_04200 [Candidatus Sulfurimonas baltica]
MVIGIVAGLLTFFLGFIGTFIVRIAIVKDPFLKTTLPTLIHFLLNAAIIIPIIGVVIALLANIYFVWVNFKMAIKA